MKGGKDRFRSKDKGVRGEINHLGMGIFTR